MNLLHAVVRSENVTAIVATHDPALIDMADRVLELSDGSIASDDRLAPAGFFVAVRREIAARSKPWDRREARGG